MKSIFLQFGIVPQALCEYECVSESVMRGVGRAAGRESGGWVNALLCVRASERNDVMKDDMVFWLRCLATTYDKNRHLSQMAILVALRCCKLLGSISVTSSLPPPFSFKT